MNILIPNATGPNIGDQSILNSTIKLISSFFPNANIVIHSTSPELYKDLEVSKIDIHIIEWALSRDKTTRIKLFRIIELIVFYFFLKFKIPVFIFNDKLIGLVNDYKEADIIICVGGGSLRSKRNIKDGILLCSLSLIYFYSKLFNVKKIILPIGFGPFGYRWHETIAAKSIAGFDLISVRERYSYDLLKKNHVANIVTSEDFGLLLDSSYRKVNNDRFTLGITVRNWLRSEEQKSMEEQIALALSRFVKKTGALIQPIVHVDSPNYKEDDDYSVTTNVVNILNTKGVSTRRIIRLKNLSDAIKNYSTLNLLLGMRMHSNIVVATQGIPFVAISYEYKTEGIARNLGMGEYCIKIEDITEEKLYDLLIKAYRNRIKLKKTISSSVDNIRRVEVARWNKIFLNFLEA